MTFKETPLKGSYEITIEPFTDERGWFGRFFCDNEFKTIGHHKKWVQLNQSFTKQKGTIRGMHYQIPPYSEIKLIKCVFGAVYDIIIDLRENSPTFLKYYSTKLSRKNKKMIYVPKGFAHGFQSLTDNAELIYHHTEFYHPNSEAGLNYNDPKLNINWPLPLKTISDRDRNHLFLDPNFKGIKL